MCGHRSLSRGKDLLPIGRSSGSHEALRGPWRGCPLGPSFAEWHCMCTQDLRRRSSCTGWFLHQCILLCVGGSCGWGMSGGSSQKERSSNAPIASSFDGSRRCSRGHYEIAGRQKGAIMPVLQEQVSTRSRRMQRFLGMLLRVGSEDVFACFVPFCWRERPLTTG